MIPFVAPPPPAMPAQTTQVQIAASTPQQALDPKSGGRRRRSPLNRRGRRHLEGEMRRRERREFRREQQEAINLRASSSPTLAAMLPKPVVAVINKKHNTRTRRFMRAFRSLVARVENKSQQPEKNS